MPRGGRRQGAGRKPKTATQHFLSGDAGKRKLALVPPSRGDAADAPPAEPPASVLVMPADLLADEAEQAYWDRYLPRALAAGTLTDATLPGFVLLCQVASRADHMWEDIQREGLTSADLVLGTLRAHPLLPAYRGLIQRQESLLQRYLLAAMAKVDAGAAAAAPKEDDDSATLRALMALK